ncbi:Dpy-30 motif-containing protein [Spironucleus salmonicida]|uniref:Dpy-30 motif-containing protein n=1 Tax=Spironucleus salmonicida TaxID=348837 RepID=V6LFX6_9EUKA|nr:Dpy-30 motif-containing protein [Spironucleus salmonicida]|eukprot:EST43460.1 Dpy-30 motif-containing protein [Spironucleus salmonicida]
MTDYITGKQYDDIEIQEYISSQNINKYLIEGCIELAKARPEKPLLWLGQWMVKNNKRKPQVTFNE